MPRILPDALVSPGPRRQKNERVPEVAETKGLADRIGGMFLAVAALTVLPVPFVAQEKDGCAAAALAMVMRHWGQPADVEAIARELREPELRGIRGSRLEAFARGRGFSAVAYKGDLTQLRDYLRKGRPLIVAWGLEKGVHDVVVVGDDGDVVLVHDPAAGASQRVASTEFERRWQRAGHWTLLVLPKSP